MKVFVVGVNQNKRTPQQQQKPLSPREKENISYVNDKTIDTTSSKNASRLKIKDNLYNFLKDSKDLRSGSKNMSASTNLTRPQSTKNLNRSNQNQRTYSTNASVLKSKRSLNESKSQEIIKVSNQSYIEKGIV
jgi:hypothetical protein